MRHRAPRGLFTLLHPRRLMRARPRLARLTGRPTLRLASGLAVMLMLATGAVVTAETLRDGAGAASYDQPTSEGRLPSGLRASRDHERATLPTAAPSTTGPIDLPGDPAPTHAPWPAPVRTPTPKAGPTSLLPTDPLARLSASTPPATSLNGPTATPSPTATSSSSPESSDDDEGTDGDSDGTSGDSDGGGDGSGDDGTTEQRHDGDPPQTHLVSGPPLAHVASFVFESDEAGTFECSLDGAGFRECDSPQLYTDLGAGWHTFKVRAVDSAGNVDPTPAVRRWQSSAPKSAGSAKDQGSSPLD
jgi:hypothetical protein